MDRRYWTGFSGRNEKCSHKPEIDTAGTVGYGHSVPRALQCFTMFPTVNLNCGECAWKLVM